MENTYLIMKGVFLGRGAPGRRFRVADRSARGKPTGEAGAAMASYSAMAVEWDHANTASSRPPATA